MTDPYEGVTDEFGRPVQDFIDTTKRLSDDMKTRLRKRTVTATSNYLYLAGLPKEPADVLAFAEYIAQSMVVTAIVDGHVSLNPEAEASEDEVKTRTTERQQGMERLLREVFPDGQAPSVVGGYL